jgi:ABC-2 type transport system permease protein
VSSLVCIIARKELRELRRDGRLHVLGTIFLLLLAGTAATTYQQHQLHVDAQRHAQTSEYERWVAQEKKNPHSAAHYGVYAFRAPGVLAFFDPGLNPYLGIAIWMEAHKQNEPLYRPAQDTGMVARFGELSPAVVLGSLLPLLLILVAGPTIAGERERGTLRQLLAQGITLRQLVAGKILALGTLALALILPILIGFGAWTLATTPSFDALIRFLMLSTVLLIYVGGALMLCTFVSLIAPTVRAALGILFAFWVFSTLIAPRVVVEVAELLHQTPSALAFRAALESDLADTRELNHAIETELFALLHQHGVRTVDQLPVNFTAVQLQLGEEHGYRIFDAHYGRLYDGHLAQERTFRLGGLLAPVIAWTSLSNGLAGSDLLHFHDFVDAAEQHRRIMQQMLNDDLLANPERDGIRYEAGPELWRTIPAFTYTAPTLTTILPTYALPFAILIVWLLSTSAAVWYAAARAN